MAVVVVFRTEGIDLGSQVKHLKLGLRFIAFKLGNLPLKFLDLIAVVGYRIGGRRYPCLLAGNLPDFRFSPEVARIGASRKTTRNEC